MGKEGEPLALDSRRTHYCGELNLSHVGEKVKLGGWVNSTRDHGGLLFLDLRDRTGVVQLVFHPEAGGLLEQAQALRAECVLWVEGQVVQRPEGRTNPALPTGQVEVVPERMEVLSTARPLPFEINGRREPDEALRLRYRYLDLRRPEMLSYLRFRHRAVKAARDFFDGRGFWEVETPMLTRSTPEGARDYLVPSRLQHGHFYALPQSPQLFKQLLMVAGVDRYFQIARCFRDEDLRADRQPEFTQIDVEMAFVREEDVLEMTEQLMAYLFRVCLGEKLDTPFPRLTWDEAMDLYGTDKPDLRFEWQLVDLSDLAAATEFRVFREALAAGGVVRGLLLPGGGLSRREVEELAGDIAPLGARGLAWVAWEAATGNEPMARGPVAKFLGAAEPEWCRRLGAKAGDVALMVAGPLAVARRALGYLRQRLGEQKGAIRVGERRFLWVTGFPLVEWNGEEKRWEAEHHPFTSPREEDLPWLETDPARVRACCYDLVLNGEELGSGSIRIHRPEVQERVLRLIGMSEEEARARFGFLLEAFSYGAPPHGGIALGLDRLLMLMSGADSMRDMIAFPKTARAACLLTGAPAPVDPAQLRELGIQVAKAQAPVAESTCC